MSGLFDVDWVEAFALGLSPLELFARGTAMFVPARDAAYELAGAGTVFRATVGEP